ncbi:hypothetical protein [Agromyces cerinus]|uniref:Uncharacterized protein n=1 Tax=Agromyces cerinus subsp. cerinus TaxID=232089 RepID=A0A1N6DQQ8_9MICO|nr:hypothetical protein [Agromyces cerinus]SIN73004.1 hypothetical protein SAMN05443544_0596 [Agromyces cerinus subsp. cerinus]
MDTFISTLAGVIDRKLYGTPQFGRGHEIAEAIRESGVLDDIPADA